MTQILHAGRVVTKGVVAFDISWEGELPQRGPVCWAMVVTSPDTAEQVRLAYEVVDGTPTQFVDDLRSGRRQPLEPDADFGDSEITVRFPDNLVGIATEWSAWKAVISVEDADVAERLLEFG